MFGSFWRFECSDFDYAVEQIVERTSSEEKRLALSLAFRLYVEGGRDRKQREKLKKSIAGDSVLVERLAGYLKPPAQGRQTWKQAEAKRRRRAEARKRKEEDSRDKWRTRVQANPEKLRDNGLPPGQVSNNQYWVYESTREADDRLGRWTSGKWKCLAQDFGEEVAQAYRDGVIQFWRSYRPQLLSEGAPANRTPFAVIFGLTGLEIEANETPDWPRGMSRADVELACRYASYELNGFPTWFPALFSAYPAIVADFLLQEIRYELSIKKADVVSHYILSDVSWSGQFAWDELAPNLCATLKKEPERLSDLGCLLNIVQGSSMGDVEIAKLASRKSKVLKQLDHAAHWFAVWVGVDPASAIPALASRFDRLTDPKKSTAFAMQFVTCLLGGRRGNTTRVRNEFCTPEYLKSLYLLMHQHIRAKDDIDRAGKGTYSPGMRDDAQDARNSLAEMLRTIPGKEAYIALTEIASVHPDETYRHWFALHAKSKAEMDADISAWTPQQVRDFHDKVERTPENHRDLAELVHLRLLDRWTGPALFERLENQLCGDYLRDIRSNRGIFLLVNQGQKSSWRIPETETSVNFDGLVSALQRHWHKTALDYPGVEHIEVIGIDLTARCS